MGIDWCAAWELLLGLAILIAAIAIPFFLSAGVERVARARRPEGRSPGTGWGTRALPVASVALTLLTLPIWGILLWATDRGASAGLIPELRAPIARLAPIWCAPVLGLWLGVVALYRVTSRDDRPKAGQSATAAIALSCWVCVGIFYFYPVFMKSVESPQKSVCVSNVKALVLAARAYADDSGAFPSGGEWCDLISPHLENEEAFVCPAEWKLRCGYAFNAALSGVDPDRLVHAAETVVIFESDQGWNAAGGPELLPDEPRHMSGDIYAFADGSVRWLHRKEIGTDEAGETIWAKRPDEEHISWELTLPPPASSEEESE
jgi:hypothetical protein